MYVSCFKKLPNYFPKWLLSFVTIPPTFGIISLFNFSHLNLCCGFYLHFPHDWCWASFHVHISFIFFWKMSIQICCPFFKNWVVLSCKNSSCMLGTNLLASIFVCLFSIFHILNVVRICLLQNWEGIDGSLCLQVLLSWTVLLWFQARTWQGILFS